MNVYFGGGHVHDVNYIEWGEGPGSPKYDTVLIPMQLRPPSL